MRTRWQVLGAALLVAATAAASTALAVHRADATDARLRAAGLARVHLSLAVPTPDHPVMYSPGAYAVTLHDDGPVGVVVQRVRWNGGPVQELHAALPADGDLPLELPAFPCPAHQVTTGLDSLDIQVAVAGGERSVRLAVPDPAQARDAVNAGCDLVGAAASLSAYGITQLPGRPGQPEFGISAFANGSQPTVVVGVRAPAGLQAQVVEALPLTVPTAPPGGGVLPHLLTIRLSLGDCAALRRTRARTGGPGMLPGGPPQLSDVQLEVQHPGEPVELWTVGYPVDEANALAALCHLPPLPVARPL